MTGCSVNACDGPTWANGYCAAHYARVRRHGDPQPHVPLKRRKVIAECTVDRCCRLSHARGLCTVHYKRLQVHGDPEGGGKYRRARGSGHRGRDGYIRIFQPGHPNADSQGRLPQHVAVMTVRLGRALYEYETVHHRNGVRDDNRPENLELWTRPQPAGQRVTDRVAWALELLETYADDPTVLPSDVVERVTTVLDRLNTGAMTI